MPVSGRAFGSGERASIGGGGSCPLFLHLSVFFSTNLKTSLSSSLYRNFLLVYYPVHIILALNTYLLFTLFLLLPGLSGDFFLDPVAATTIVSRKTREGRGKTLEVSVKNFLCNRVLAKKKEGVERERERARKAAKCKPVISCCTLWLN